METSRHRVDAVRQLVLVFGTMQVMSSGMQNQMQNLDASTGETSDGLSLTFNDTTGSPNITFRGRHLVAGIPGLYGLTIVNGTENYPWTHKVLNHTFLKNTLTNLITYPWGTLSTTYTQTKDTLDLSVTVANNFNATFSSMSWFLFGGLDSEGRWNFGGCNATSAGCADVRSSGMSPCPGSWLRPQSAGAPRCSMTVPQVLVADWGSGALVTTTVSNAAVNGTLSYPWIAGGFRLQLNLVNIPPGTSAHFPVSLRFAPGTDNSGGPDRLLGLANDTFDNYRKERPITVAWNDRRPIGALFPSDCGASCNCKTYSPADCPNPRGWNFLPGKEAAFNVTSPAGVQAFQQAARDYVNNSIQYCKYYLGGPDGTGPAGCQGIIIWSLAGQQYPQTTSWVGDPRMLPVLAPEMDGVADDLFGLIRRSGMQCGMSLRPQAFTQNPAWNASLAPMQRPFKYFQHFLTRPDNTSDTDAIATLLIAKAGYAYKRWGCTLYYVDTTVDAQGHVLDPDVFAQVHKALPHCLFFPEESSFADHSSVTPLQDDWGGHPLGTSLPVEFTYGRSAFSFELMQFTPGGSGSPSEKIYLNQTLIDEWVPLVARGDVLLIDAWYNNSVNVFVKSVYETAAQRDPLPTH